MQMAAEAETLLLKLPPEEKGCFYLNTNQKPVCPDPNSAEFVHSIVTSAVSKALGPALRGANHVHKMASASQQSLTGRFQLLQLRF